MNKLTLEILADASPFIKNMNQAQSALNTFTKASESAGASLGGGVNRALGAFKDLAGGGANAAGVLAGAFVAATTAAFAMTVQAGKIAEQTEQLAQKTGIAAKSLEGMSVALARNGLESGSIATAMRGLSKEIVGVSQGTASSVKLFQSMGVSLDVVEKGTGATLRAIANAFQRMPDGAEKAKIAVELFGRSGLDLIPILNKGAAGLDEAMKKSAEFGLILSDTARGELTIFDDAMDDLGSALKGFTLQVGAAFAPSLTALVNGFTQAIVFTKNVFNEFADAASKLSIRLAAMVAAVQLLGQTLFSLKAFSKAAWDETINHVKAIDAWAASELHGVEASREASNELATLAMKQLDAGKAAEVHANSQERLGQQIVAATKIQLSQIDALGKQQERMGGNIVSGAQVTMSIDMQEGQRQERLGKRIQEEFTVSQQIAQDWVDSYNVQEDAAMARFQAEMDGMDRNQESLGRHIVAQSVAAQQVKGFWETQLDAVVASNAFSVGQIISTWTSGIANAIVNGGNFVKAAWQQTQVAIIQGALNTGVQLAAEWALQAGIFAKTASALLVGHTATQSAMTSVSLAADAQRTAASFAASKIMGASAVAAVTAGATAMLAVMNAVVIAIAGVFAAIGAGLAASIVGAVFAPAFEVAAGAVIVSGTVAMALASAAVTAAIAGATAASLAPGFSSGGIGDFGSGTPATLHGQEAIIPLNSRGAAFMQEAMGTGGGTQLIQVQSILDGRVVADSISEHMPGAWRRAGLPA